MMPNAPSNPTDRRALLAGIGGLAAGTILTAGRAEAGPLNPPAAPAPTMKRLDEVEPRIPIGPDTTPGNAGTIHRISEPGSYYLTGDIIGESGKDGIRIEASDVSIDLMGFALRGISGSSRGIRTNGLRHNLVIRNGTIANWGSAGISLTIGGNGTNSILEHLLTSGNGLEGIRANRNAVIRSCLAHDNNDVGILGAQNATISDCAARGNAGDGIVCNQGSIIVNCSARENGGRGIQANGRGCMISHCAADSNGGIGIEANDGCVVQHCASRNNALDGIRVEDASTVTDCVAIGNNTANDETSAGIFVGTGCVVTNCLARSSIRGIVAVGGCLVSGCVCSGNDEHGIIVLSRCTVRGNTCSENNGSSTSSGIAVAGAGNRLEGNNCTSNPRGFSVLVSGNVVIGNSVSQAGVPYIIVNNNSYGDVLTVSGPITSSNPWANLVY